MQIPMVSENKAEAKEMSLLPELEVGRKEMKRIVFPFTNRAHVRQQLLLDELRKHFEVDVFEPTTPQKGGMSAFSILVAIEFQNFLAKKEYDATIIRADRFELLHIAGLCAYKEIPIFHIEGGADTGKRVIDSKVRHAISELADYHLVTDEYAKRKVIYLGADPERVFNVGSLDVSFAKSVEPKKIINEDYILFLHHAIPGEDTGVVYEAIKDLGYKIVGIKSNQDYQTSLMHEEYSPEDFISIMHYAKCFVSNSSAACKEASIIGVPVVLTGTRQDGRLVGRNVLRVPHKLEEIKNATKYQIEHGRYEPDEVYYKEGTEQKIVQVFKDNL